VHKIGHKNGETFILTMQRFSQLSIKLFKTKYIRKKWYFKQSLLLTFILTHFAIELNTQEMLQLPFSKKDTTSNEYGKRKSIEIF